MKAWVVYNESNGEPVCVASTKRAARDRACTQYYGDWDRVADMGFSCKRATITPREVDK